mgnify:FL=1
MSDFYIKVDDNNFVVGHPYIKSNMQQTTHVSHDFSEGSPEGFVEFIHVPPPEIGVYQKFDPSVGASIALAFNHNGLEYRLEDGVCRMVWHVIDMTESERNDKIAARQSEWASADLGWDSWTWNESICDYEPPVPYPDDGGVYNWDEGTRSWVVLSS